MAKIKNISVALSVASSDSGCNAGIQADLLTFASHKVFGTTAIAALTAQNPNKVKSIFPSSANFLKDQLETINDFYKPKAMKSGMLFNADLINILASFTKKNRDIKFVLDPVMISSSGKNLLEKSAVKSLKENLIPLANVFTPNLDEAQFLLNKGEITDMKDAAFELQKTFQCSVLLKGGHLQSDKICDVLCENGKIFQWHSKRIKNIDTHGSGCTLSAAICANLALGKNIFESCSLAREYLLCAFKNSLKLSGSYFINHFPPCKKI